MDSEQLKRRTRELALRVITLVRELPHEPAADVIGKQILRSATSVGANYSASCRGRSDAERIAKLCIVLEEADETIYWLELLIDAGIYKEVKLAPLLRETNEIVAMTVSSIKTLRARKAKAKAEREAAKAKPQP